MTLVPECVVTLACALQWSWAREDPRWWEAPRRCGFTHLHLQAQLHDQGDLARMVDAASRAKLPVTAISWSWPSDGPEALHGALQAAQALHARWLIVPWAYLPDHEAVEQWATTTGPQECPQALSRWKELFGRFAGTVLVDVAHPLTIDPRPVVQALGRWNDPQVRVWLDLGAQAARFPWSPVEVALQRWFGLVGGLGLRDAEPEVPLQWVVAPGQGSEVDFARIWQIVSAAGYSGLATVFVGRRAGRRGQLSIDQWQAQVIQALEYLSCCGWPVSRNSPGPQQSSA